MELNQLLTLMKSSGYFLNKFLFFDETYSKLLLFVCVRPVLVISKGPLSSNAVSYLTLEIFIESNFSLPPRGRGGSELKISCICAAVNLLVARPKDSVMLCWRFMSIEYV